MHYVYILIPLTNARGEPDKKKFSNWLYTGYTPDPERRLKKHNNGEVKSTKARRPYRMIIAKEFDNKTEAVAYERQLKKSSSKKKELVAEYLDKNLN